MKIHRTLTPGRRAWLEKLRDSAEPLRRGRGSVGYACMHLGWTEWAYRYRDTRYRLTRREVEDVRNTRRWDDVEMFGEVITDAGLAMLAQSQQ